MQEDQTVTFEPIYDGYHFGWLTNVFALYLTVVFGFTLVRFVRFSWSLHKLGRLRKRAEKDRASVSMIFAESYSRIRTLKELTALTFLLCLFDLSWETTNVLAGLQTQKAPGYRFALTSIGYALSPFSLGLLACVLLYSGAMLFRVFLDRQRRSFELQRAIESDGTLQA